MLKIYDKNHNAIGHIVKYKDCKIESEVATGDKTLSFVYLAKHHNLQNEMYVQSKDDEYVIKEVPATTGAFPQIVAVLNLEDLQRDMWQTFSVTDATIDEAVRTVLAGTGWTIDECDVTKRRNAGMMQVSTLEVIQNLCTAYMCEPVFDTIGKKVSFYAQRGEDKGVYFMSGLNLKKLQKKSTSYDYYTRIIPIGQNNLSIADVNDGKDYLENYQYSSKVLTYIWKDESYTDPQALMEDAQLKLNDLSKPEISYSADVRDLAKQKPEYGVLSYGLGDTVTIIDQETGTREKQRIKKMVEYPQDPEKNTCEIANTVLTFEEMQQKYQAAINIINNTVAGDGRYTGTINVSDILNFEKGLADSSTIGGIQGDIADMEGDLAGIKLTIGQIDTNFLKAEEADLKYATIENLNVVREDVHDLNADYATFKSATANEFSAHTARIDTVIGDLASYKTTITDELIAAKGWMAEGAIGNAQISSVDANKLRAGTIDTALVTIAGSDGKLQITDNTMKISDANRVRVQVGKDASGDYTLAVWDKAGNLIWDALGATDKTIQRKIIRDNVIADDAAIQALKIDFQSFDTVLTDQGVTISGTVVQVGSKTLNVALSEQTQINTSYSEQLASHSSKITANEKAIALKVSSQTYEKDKTTMESTLQTVESSVSVMDGQITALVQDVTVLQGDYNGLDSRTAKLELDSDNFAVELSSTKKTVSDNYTSLKQYTDSAKSSAISTAAADATSKANKALADAKTDATTKADAAQTAAIASAAADATSKADSALNSAKSYADSAVDGVQVGGRNLLRKFIEKGSNTSKIDELSLQINTVGGDTYFFLKSWCDLDTETEYTVSCDASGVPDGFRKRFVFLNDQSSKFILDVNRNGRLSATGKLSKAITAGELLLIDDLYSDSSATLTVPITLSNFKLERGTKPTDYTPAPEDTQSQIDSTNAVVATHTTTLSEHDTRITANENAISLKVWSKDVDSAIATVDGKFASYSTTTEMQSAIEVAKSEISLAVSETYTTKQEFGALEIGGRNLLRNSNFDSIDGWSNLKDGSSEIVNEGINETKCIKLTGALGANRTVTNTIVLSVTPNEEYTFSGWYKMDSVQFGTTNPYTCPYVYYTDSEKWVAEKGLVIMQTGTRGWTYVKNTFKVPNNDKIKKMRFQLYARDFTGTIWWDNLKLEKGTKATDWTPAPEDTDSKITSLETWKTEASQKITKDGIIATVGNYYAYQSDLDTAENRITQAESAIEQHAGEIALTVKEQDVTGNYIVGKLNLSSTTAKIAAKNIDLSGYVTVSSLKTAGSTTIDGSNITTGTISADRIDADALMTKKLTATNLTVTGNSVFSGVLDGATGTFAGSLSAATGSFSGAVTATGGTIGGWDITATRIKTSKTIYMGYKEAGMMLMNEANNPYLYTQNASGQAIFSIQRNGTIMLHDEGQGSENFTVQYKTSEKTTLTSYGMKAYSEELGAIASYCTDQMYLGDISSNAYTMASAEGIYTTGRITTGNSVVGLGFAAGGQFNAQHNGYGTIFRNDGNAFYILLSNQGSPDSFNSLRPFIVNLASGKVEVKTDFYCTNWGSGTTVRRPVASASSDGKQIQWIESKKNSSGTYYITVNGQFAGSDFSSKNINCTTSDIRLKTNVVDCNMDALSVINQIQVREFDWKENGIHQKIGFVADELEAIDSNLAFGGGYNEDGSMDVKSVNEFYLVGYLTKGIQELHTAQLTQADELLTHKSQIEYLLDENAALKKRVKELEKQIA